MGSVNLEKTKLRQTFRINRLMLTKDEIKERSRAINENFLNNLFPKIYPKKTNKIFSLYLATSNEVRTDIIAEFLKKNNIVFSYPKIIAPNNPLKFLVSESTDQFAANQFYPKILEPISGKEVLPDFLLLPLLAFDRHLYRLGMGGGFFDRTIEFLKKQKPEILTVGLAYGFQRAEHDLPIEKTDRRLDFIVTEKDVFASEPRLL